MVHKGFRKGLDVEAQKRYIARLEAEAEAERWRKEYRRAVRLFQGGRGGGWFEYTYEQGKIRVESYYDLPDFTAGLSVGIESGGTFYPAEIGLTADGLFHAVWLRGTPDKPQLKLVALYVNSLPKICACFWELYNVRVSIPMLLIGMRDLDARQQAREADIEERLQADLLGGKNS